MAIKGVTKNINLQPILGKDIDRSELFVPLQVELNNGEFTSTGGWRFRKGYSEEWDTGVLYGVHGLLNTSLGYAFTKNGTVYQLSSTPVSIGTIGTSRPQFERFNSIDYVTSGSTHTVQGNLITDKSITAKYIGKVGSYMLYASDGTEFQWSASNNPDNITTGDSGSANVKKSGTIKYATDFRNQWLIFKDDEVEVWYNRGGTTPFVRLNESTIPFGCGASYSVVEAENQIYWLDPDMNFRDLQGQIISSNLESSLKDRMKTIDNVYGIHFTDEKCIRWFNPDNNITLRYDYANQLWSEDYHLVSGHKEMFPVGAYMEKDGKQYIGDSRATGKVFDFNYDDQDDNGDMIQCVKQFKVKISEAGNMGSVNRIRFILKRGIDTATVTAPTMLMKWRFDENEEDIDWYTRSVDLGVAPDRNLYHDEYALGLGRSIEFQLVQTNPVSFLISGILMTVDEKGY